MRLFLRVMIVAITIGSLMPDAALCQPADDFDEHFDDDVPAPQPTPRSTKKPAAKTSWRNNPVTWTIGAAALIRRSKSLRG